MTIGECIFGSVAVICVTIIISIALAKGAFTGVMGQIDDLDRRDAGNWKNVTITNEVKKPEDK